MVLCLSYKDNFTPFLAPGLKWEKKSSTVPYRGLISTVTPDGKTVLVSAEMKAQYLDQMLNLIAHWAPQYLSSDIIDLSTSLDSIWISIRKYYGLKKSEVNFIKFLSMTREPNERPQRLFRRLLAHIEDNLLTKDSDLKHDGQSDYEEVITPTIERLVLLRWLELLHPGLPNLIATKMAFDLQKNTLKDIHDQICEGLEGFLEELLSSDTANIMVNQIDFEDENSAGSVSYVTGSRQQNRRPVPRPFQSVRPSPKANVSRFQWSKNESAAKTNKPSCRICLAEGRPYFHSLADCDYLCRAEKRALAAAFSITTDVDENQPGETEVKQVNIVPSPSFVVYYNKKPVKITIDTGATSSIIDYNTAKRLNLSILPSKQQARLADFSHLQIIGEVFLSLNHGQVDLQMDALVAEGLHCEALVGMPFMKSNFIVIDVPNDCVVVKGKHRIPTIHNNERDPTAYSVHCTEKLIYLHPGDSIPLETPFGTCGQKLIALEPKPELSGLNPTVAICNDGEFFFTNDSDNIVSIHRNQQLATVHTVHTPLPDDNASITRKSYPVPNHVIKDAANGVLIDPDEQWDDNIRQQFKNSVTEFNDVFDESIGKYNDASGRVRAHITIGSTQPPKSKAIIPSYDSDKLSLMQSIMDDLEAQGVMAKPEDMGIVVEQVSPSFLIPKKTPNDFRLVTSFNRLAQYVKPPPSKSTSTEEVLIFLSRWKHVIKTDMAKQFYQLPMDKESMKYVATMTPFKGLRIYCRAAMGMPGSSENLDELMSRVLGELLHRGTVAKIADDIYIGGNSPEELLQNWVELLHVFKRNNLRLSASKTVINPQETVILGWVWKNGNISPSPHRLSTLAHSEPPSTIKGLRSWLGAVKHIKQCIQNYAPCLGPLEEFVGGKESRDKIDWTDELLSTFQTAQNCLNEVKTITVSRPSDQLIIVTDGAVKSRGIGATLYINRDGKSLLGGFFSAKLPIYQSRWLPCEVEGLAISAAVKYWANYIRESRHTTQILSDSKPCVQAYAKLLKGEFSSRSRICAFLSIVSDSKVTISHISGDKNIVSDHQSRNPIICPHANCQMCQFVTEQVTVSNITATDILSGKAPVPFISPQAWRECQQECPHLRRVFGYIRSGTRPSRKSREPTQVKRYLQHASIGNGQLLVVKKPKPFMPTTNLIIVPETIIDGLLTAMHLKLHHPSRNQLRKVFDRKFFALNIDHHIENVTDSCASCKALRSLPKEVPEFTSSEPSQHPGTNFSADVLRRSRQFILIVRENFSSYTNACLLTSEKHTDLREGLLRAVIPLMFSDSVKIRVDPAPGFLALQNDELLSRSGIYIEIGDRLNVNKNPVAEKAIREFEHELKTAFSRSEPVTDADIQKISKILNNRIRSRDLSAEEILFQRNSTGIPISVNDNQLRVQQIEDRSANHDPSARCKVPIGKPVSLYNPKPGDLVLIKVDGTKHTGRDQHIVIASNNDYVQLRKLCGNQFRSKLIKVKCDQIYPISSQNTSIHDTNIYDSLSEDEDEESVPIHIHEDCLTDSEDLNVSENFDENDDLDLNTSEHLVQNDNQNLNSSENFVQDDISNSDFTESNSERTSRYGRQIRPPDRFGDFVYPSP